MVDDAQHQHLIGAHVRDNMRVLNVSECSAWLKSKGCPESPYGKGDLVATSYLQFGIPKTDGTISLVIDAIRNCLRSPKTCLFQMADWSRYAEFENAMLIDLESKCPPDRPTFAAVGILFEPCEADEMFGCCSSVINCGMSAYLFAAGIATFYLWEGDRVDVWLNTIELYDEMVQWLRNEGVHITSTVK
ncbi:hypothetical protein FAZ95_26400 [Trinickia violacea]|uniref:Uncharacterized protein n=1 Tax=Trinickia violacea TaxID=2571746 RepID=A0A4P8IUB1_9BURK|nr:hypothetical protein [Trinickia violacea]QCP52682.1 hypothetical protein FAZ95_26400 [Trinickia violacea]